MTAVNVYDTLVLTVRTDTNLRVQSAWSCGMRGKIKSGHTFVGDLPDEKTDIVTRALTLLRERAEVEYGASVRITKRIPSAAGLGGASSDAAAALLVANRAWQIGWDDQRLIEMAAELGSDVPFFLQRGTTAICRGRGERIETVSLPAGYRFVIVRPPMGLSTADVYQHIKLPNGNPLTCQPLIHALRSGDMRRLRYVQFNRLEESAGKLSQWIGRLKQEFGRLPVVAHQMSGSGTSYFGVCRHALDATRIANTLRSRRAGHVIQAAAVPAYPVIYRLAI